MAGLLCARQLKQAGVDCVLVEQDRLCGGVTKNTTAKITVQHGLIYHKLMDLFGVEKAKLYLQANQAALEQYEELCRDIDCDFEEQDSFVYSLTDRASLIKETAALKQLDVQAGFREEVSLPFPVAGAVRVKGQAPFHPLKFAAAVAEGTAKPNLCVPGAEDTARELGELLGIEVEAEICRRRGGGPAHSGAHQGAGTDARESGDHRRHDPG